MNSSKSSQFMKPLITTRKINNLVKKALLDRPEYKPAKGMMFLEDKEIGSVFETDNLKGILLDVNDSAAQVVILSSNHGEDPYYLGKQRIGSKTEVFI
jgi:hypothetical protein